MLNFKSLIVITLIVANIFAQQTTVEAQKTAEQILAECIAKLNQFQNFNTHSCGSTSASVNNIPTTAAAPSARSSLNQEKLVNPEQKPAIKISNIPKPSIEKLYTLPIVVAEEELLFKFDENPEKDVISVGCVDGEIEIIEKCYPSFLDELRSGKVTIEQIQNHMPFRFGIKGQGGSDDNNRRKFQFHHENFARQDAGLTIFDGYHNSANSKSYATEIVFIPRNSVPNYQVKNNEVEVTLANGEKMNFDSKTGKIKGGVVKESNIQKGKEGKFTYTGKNIMIQTTGLDGGSKSFLETANTATITKDGKTCSNIPFEKLWTRPVDKKASQFRFSTDEAFHNWLENESSCFK